MIIKDWKSSEDMDTDRVCVIRSTITHHGKVIHDKGNFEGPPEFSPRRYSIIELIDGETWLIIGSISYSTPFDSENPLEPMNKYLAGEFEITFKIKYPGSFSEAITYWFGSFQSLRTIIPNFTY